MREELKKIYPVDALRKRVPQEQDEFFQGFSPWEADVSGWEHSMRENLFEAPDRPLRRSVWNHPETPEARILLDIVECASTADAIESLLGRLEGNQLASLPEGPVGLGIASFVHPEGIPPAVFFVRGNLCISILSFARSAVAVLPWAQRIDSRLTSVPKAERKLLSLRPDRNQAKAGEAVPLFYELPWKPTEESYLKFVANGGTFSRREDNLFIIGTSPGQVQVEAFLVESGREPISAHFVLAVE